MLRCILVDDEQLGRERFRALLAKAEADVEIVGEAENGKQAVPMIYELKPDLVFLDIQMPGLTGFEVLDLLAARAPTSFSLLPTTTTPSKPLKFTRSTISPMANSEPTSRSMNSRRD